MPDPGNKLGEAFLAVSARHAHRIMTRARTDIVRVELVHADEDADGRGAEGPRAYGPEYRELALVQVVHQTRVELRATTSAYTQR